MSKFKPLARQSGIVIQEFADEILIYDLRADKAFNLNETSALIWQLSTGERTVSQIAEDLSRKFNSVISEEFVWLALERLSREKLIENNSEIAGLLEGFSRREAIRRIGLTTAIAFPFVLSLFAPNAVNAQSCPGTNRPNGCPCNLQSQCTSSCCSSAPRTCVAGGSKGVGVTCIANCECQAGLTCKGSPQTCQP